MAKKPASPAPAPPPRPRPMAAQQTRSRNRGEDRQPAQPCAREFRQGGDGDDDVAAGYRHQTLADLQHLVLEPLIRDRVAIAQRDGKNAAEQDIAGVAIWASLSDEAEGRLRDQIKGGAWPVRLKPEDWTSGQNNWLIDVIATDKAATASVIANFGKVAKEGSLKLHPLITRLVDEEDAPEDGSPEERRHERAGPCHGTRGRNRQLSKLAAAAPSARARPRSSPD